MTMTISDSCIKDFSGLMVYNAMNRDKVKRKEIKVISNIVTKTLIRYETRCGGERVNTIIRSIVTFEYRKKRYSKELNGTKQKSEELETCMSHLLDCCYYESIGFEPMYHYRFTF